MDFRCSILYLYMNRNIIIHKNIKTVEALLKETSMHPGVLVILVEARKKRLEQACEKFDHSRGFKFAAYAI